MATDRNEALAQFLAEQQATIARLIWRAYQETGGHYATMSVIERRDQAETDSREFIYSLLRGEPDRAAIDQTVQSNPDLLVATSIVRMSLAFERMFVGLVKDQLADVPILQREVLRRSALVFARFRLGMSTAQIERIVRGAESGLAPEDPLP